MRLTYHDDSPCLRSHCIVLADQLAAVIDVASGSFLNIIVVDLKVLTTRVGGSLLNSMFKMR